MSRNEHPFPATSCSVPANNRIGNDRIFRAKRGKCGGSSEALECRMKIRKRLYLMIPGFFDLLAILFVSIAIITFNSRIDLTLPYCISGGILLCGFPLSVIPAWLLGRNLECTNRERIFVRISWAVTGLPWLYAALIVRGIYTWPGD